MPSRDERTMIGCILPLTAVADNAVLLFPAAEHISRVPLLLAVLTSLPFDYIVRQKMAGAANGKRYISDEETLREMEFSAACEARIEAEKRFQRLDRLARAQKGVPENMVEWFDALESRYLTDKKLWQLFTVGYRSVRSNKMYNEYRSILLRGGKLLANA